MKGLKKLPALLLALVVLICALPAGAAAKTAGEENDVRAGVQSSMGEMLGFGALYDYVLSAIENGVPDESGRVEIDVRSYGLKTSDVHAFLGALSLHNPQLFYWQGNAPYSLSGDTVLKLYIPFTVVGEELQQKKQRFESWAQELYDLRQESWSDLETVLFFSDYLAANYEYDLTYSNYDAYSFFDEGKGVCQAYTAVFQLLMNRFGIPCTYANSDSINHIWNVVCVGGNWYHLDVTHNDPVYDRPGAAYHEYTLTGASTTYSLKCDYAQRVNRSFTDMTLGMNVTISESDHPVRALLLDSIAPVTWLDGSFYGILQNVNDNGVTLSASLDLLDLNEPSATFVKSLATTWRIPGYTYYYPTNYSSLVSDGRFLFYFDSTTLYSFDPIGNTEKEMVSVTADVDIYGLQYRGDALVYYTGDSPGDASYTATVFELPYFTITWLIADETYVTRVRYGRDPLEFFNGSTEREDDEGVAYIFIGWSPEVLDATEDATYTAMYEERQLFVRGDMNNDGSVDVTDVTALLNYIANPAIQVPANTRDVNGDGDVDVTDVTALLNLIAAQTA